MREGIYVAIVVQQSNILMEEKILIGKVEDIKMGGTFIFINQRILLRITEDIFANIA